MNASAARCPGTARSWSISASRVLMCLDTSFSGNAGSQTASLISARASPRWPLATSMSTPRPDSLAPAPSAIPWRSSSSANSSAVWRTVPSSRVRAMIVPMPSRPRGSDTSGTGTASRTEMTYCPGMS